MATNYGVPEFKSSIAKRDTVKYHGSPENLPPFDMTCEHMDANKSYFGVRIVNGKMSSAGTSDTGVYIAVIGTNGSTGKVYLVGYLSSLLGGIDSSTHEDLIIETENNLGDVQVVVLGNDEGMWVPGASWFVNKTIVYGLIDKTEEVFPCYHWIGDGDAISTTSKTTTLKDVQGNDILIRERSNQLEARKQQYQWQLFPDSGVPSGIDDSKGNIPEDEQFSRVKNIDFSSDAMKAVVNLGLSGLTIKVDSLEDYVELGKSLQQGDLKIHEACRWSSDVEYGRQILNGVNPVIIKKCTKLPPNFPVTPAMVQPFFTRGMTLAQEMEAGHIYICDMSIMDGLPPRDGCYAPAPICLFYVNSSNQLVPIAIQLKQGIRDEEKSEPNPIFLPSDNWIDWILAKMYYRAAHSQFHQLSTHYISCHAAMEAYCMGTVRNLPDAHPICKLLRPHFRYTLAINTRARSTLINDGGIIDQFFGIGGQGKVDLFKRISKSYTVDWTNIKKNIKERGVDNPTQLPGYYYRDDGLKVWNALEQFVSDVINTFYATDEEVKNDAELQNWAKDLCLNGFPGFSGGKNGRGFPENVTTKEDLIEQCTRIMFTGSAQHASVNFGQHVIYGYVPNAPFSMHQPPPVKKGVADYQTLLDTLPDKGEAVNSMTTTYLLSQYSNDEMFLGKYPIRFTEKDIQHYIERLNKALNGISGEIKVRNEGLDVPYTYMLPENIPNSITI